MNVSLANMRRWGPALAGRVAVAAMAALAMLALARALERNAFGHLYTVITVAVLVGAIAETGLPMVLARTVAIDDHRGEAGRVGAALRFGIGRAAGLGLGIGVVGGLVVGAVLQALSVRWAVIMVAAWATHLAVATVVEATLTSLRQPGRSQFPRIVGWGTIIVGTIALDLANPDAALALFAAGSIAGLGTSALLAWPRVRVADGPMAISMPDDETLGRRRQYTGTVRFVNAALPVGEAALVAALAGPAATGTLGVARSIARPMTLLASSVASVLAPDLAVAHQHGGRRRLWRLLRRVWRASLPLAFLGLVLLGAVAALVVDIAVDNYESVVPVTLILLAAGAVNLATGPVGVALQMADGERQLARITVVSAVLFVAAVSIGAWIAGAPGAAAASLVAAVFNNLWCISTLRPSQDGAESDVAVGVSVGGGS